ncbi:fumarylacetoacetate hydrolase family protein [Streptomyces sp. ID05-26A]|nr:fumarylacetoacetate hydrolase family protein [Streptomyces sp. ID05-26A]
MDTSFGLGTFAQDAGDRFPGLVLDDRVRDLRDVAESVWELLQNWDEVLPALHRIAAGPGPWRATEGLRVCAPLEPGQVIQAGANYRTHVIDLAVRHSPGRDADEVRAETAEMMDRRAATGEPYLFVGLPSAITGPHDDVTLPAYSDQHDWELELAVVIGREAFRVDRAHALEHVAGYTIANDLTTRDLVFRRDMPELGADWFRSKNAPGFTPLGPWLVPAEFVSEDPRITLRLNGEVMQDESTKDMIFNVAALVSAASHTTPLRPGDVVLTGSPAGNGFHHGRLLRAGDVMEGTITGLGTQRTRCVAP